MKSNVESVFISLGLDGQKRPVPRRAFVDTEQVMDPIFILPTLPDVVLDAEHARVEFMGGNPHTPKSEAIFWGALADDSPPADTSSSNGISAEALLRKFLVDRDASRFLINDDAEPMDSNLSNSDARRIHNITDRQDDYRVSYRFGESERFSSDWIGATVYIESNNLRYRARVVSTTSRISLQQGDRPEPLRITDTIELQDIQQVTEQQLESNLLKKIDPTIAGGNASRINPQIRIGDYVVSGSDKVIGCIIGIGKDAAFAAPMISFLEKHSLKPIEDVLHRLPSNLGSQNEAGADDQATSVASIIESMGIDAEQKVMRVLSEPTNSSLHQIGAADVQNALAAIYGGRHD